MTSTPSRSGKTLFISGASRGIGLAIGVRAARDGANVVIAAKTTEPHPKLPGTIYTAAKEIEDAGGKALPLMVDIREEAQVLAAVAKTVETFGGIDILINNASAISLTGTLQTPMKRYDLMHSINTRGTFLCSQACLPHLLKAKNPHILNLSPPLNMRAHWFQNHVAYTMAKYGMSMCVLGMAAEFADNGVAVNALWPRTAIATSAINLIGGPEMMAGCRTVDIMSDAAHVILTRESRKCTGNFFLDEDLLRETGMTDFEKYSVTPGTTPIPDFFVD
jgi:citronellol/citronellal dehydrogenase